MADPESGLRLSSVAKAWPGSGFRFAAAVTAARRLPCGARSWGLPHNSLRSLRSLRSDRCGKSEVDARCARGPKTSAPRRRRGAPPAARPRLCEQRRVLRESRGAACEAAGGCLAQRLCGAEERRFRGQRAQRASTSDLRHLSERSERSERSELCRRPRDRAPQGSRPARPTAAVGAEPGTRPRLRLGEAPGASQARRGPWLRRARQGPRLRSLRRGGETRTIQCSRKKSCIAARPRMKPTPV